jgi:hypothetical protein
MMGLRNLALTIFGQLPHKSVDAHRIGSQDSDAKSTTDTAAAAPNDRNDRRPPDPLQTHVKMVRPLPRRLFEFSLPPNLQ